MILMAPDHAFALLRPMDGDGPTVIRGPRTTARYHTDGPGPRCAELRLRPGQAAGLLGDRPLPELIDREVTLPLRELTDRPLAVPELGRLLRGLIDRETTLPLRGLADGEVVVPEEARPLRELADGEVVVPELGRLVRGLADRGPAAPVPRRARASGGLIDRAVGLLTAGEPVHAVARRLHVSERHLRTLFVAATGLTPTAFVRLDRVRSVLAEPGWGRYYDQSHMIAEFRRVMGVPPGAYARGHRPPASPCPSAPPVE